MQQLAGEEDEFTVLLSHRPAWIEQYLPGGWDLILSGHAHGGQWRIPGLLNGLLAKNAIREAGFVKRGKTYGRLFLPTMSREEYFAANIFSHRHKPEIVALIRALLSREDITPDEMAQIKAILEEK
mgnify:CR=1 FL=1